MTSDQIRDSLPTDLSANAWLKEIAFQLAKMNEESRMEPPKLPTISRRKVQ